MSAMPGQPPAALPPGEPPEPETAPEPGTTDGVEHQPLANVIARALDAVYAAAESSIAKDDPREVKELAGAALNFAQAAVILDPDLVAPQGVPADALHPPLPHIQKDSTNGQGASSSTGGPSAPAPNIHVHVPGQASRKLTVKRGADGAITGVEG